MSAAHRVEPDRNFEPAIRQYGFGHAASWLAVSSVAIIRLAQWFLEFVICQLGGFKSSVWIEEKFHGYTADVTNNWWIC